ncbi:MAG: alpha/beta hydrolase family protein [Cognaticolwellia sp.]
MRKQLSILLLFTIFFFNTPLSANNWDSLFDKSLYKDAKISPDGKHLAVAIRHEGSVILVFFQRDTMELVGKVDFTDDYEPGDYLWVNNERVVIQLVKQLSTRELPVSYGELFAANLDGTKGEMIFGMHAGDGRSGSRLRKKKASYAWGYIVDTLPGDDEHILISSTPMSKSQEALPSVIKLNVYSGIVKKNYGRSPISYANFLINNRGIPAVVTGTDKHNDNKVYVQKNSQWQALPDGTVGDRVRPLSLSKSGKFLYTIDNHQQDRRGIFKLNLDDFSYTSVFTDKTVDITDVEMSTDGRSAYAIRVDENYPAYIMLDKKNQEAKIFKMLLQAFPYSEVNITSRTEDGNVYIVYVSSDIDPGSLYVFDKAQNKISLLFKYFPNHQSKDMIQMEPIKATVTDNSTIHGFFTPAKSSTKAKPAPVVVMVHGGPHGPRDYWGFSNSVQYLALNGYSVLQVNYRGSGGYGNSFETAGYRKWGSLIQQDIYDTYQSLIKQGKASAGNACIMGASFGAYSAIQSAAIYPDTYQCAIANAGIYDLELMFDEGDIKNRRAGVSYLKMVLGTDSEQLKSMSPTNYVEKITIPLLLAHGEDDERAPFEHAERLRAALDKAKKPYEWYAVDHEGHGFYNPENQKAYMRKVLSFLGNHLNK